MPSNQADHRGSRCPWIRISYQVPWSVRSCRQARSRRDEQASSHVMNRRDELAANRSACASKQAELVGPSYGRPTVVDAELGEDVVGVGAHGVQGHAHLARDVRPAEVAAQQPQHVELAAAQRVDERLASGRSVGADAVVARGLAPDGSGAQQSTLRSRPSGRLPARAWQQLGHRRTFVDEHADVPPRPRPDVRRRRASVSADPVSPAATMGEGLQDQDLDHGPHPAAVLGAASTRRPRRAGRLGGDSRVPRCRVLREQHPGEGDVLVLAQVGELVRRRPRPAGVPRPRRRPVPRAAASTRARTAATGRTFGAKSPDVDPFGLLEQLDAPPAGRPAPRRTRAIMTRHRYGFCGRPAPSPSSSARRR